MAVDYYLRATAEMLLLSPTRQWVGPVRWHEGGGLTTVAELHAATGMDERRIRPIYYRLRALGGLTERAA